METLYIRILHRPPRLDVHQFDLPFYPPRQKMPRCKLRPVVATKRFRHSALCNDPIQLPRHPPARKTGVHFQRQTFTRVHVDHAQHPKLPPALRRIRHKIQGPFLVRSRHRRPHKTSSQQPFSSLPPDQQPGLPVHPIHPLVVHAHSLPLQLHLQPPIPPLRLLPRRRDQPFPQLRIVPLAHVPLARLRHSHPVADPPLAHQKMLPQPVHFPPPLYELHPFFSITAFNMSLSRLRSPTSFFSRPFSSSSCRSRCASPTVIPPYFAFHAYTVCFDTPSSRPPSAALLPPPRPPCASPLPAPAPPPPRSSPPPSVSTPRSSPLRYTSSSPCSLLLLSPQNAKIIYPRARKMGGRSVVSSCLSVESAVR